MYTATITDTKKEHGITKVTVELTNGTDTTVEKYQLTEAVGMAELKEMVKDKIKDLEKITIAPEKIKKGVIDLSDPVAAPIELTPEQRKKEEYERKFGLLQKAKMELELKIITQQEYDVILNEIKALKLNL